MTDSSRTKILITQGDPLITAGLAFTLKKRHDFDGLRAVRVGGIALGPQVALTFD